MFKELVTETPCSVSTELVEFVAGLNEELFIDEAGVIKVTEVLFYLGFKIEAHTKNKNYYTIKNALIRDPSVPHRTYRTTVYNGQLRSEVDYVDITGKVHYSKIPHRLARYYANYEVLTLTNLSEVLEVGEFIEINTIGALEHYNN